jgi:hypothetical protein
MRKRGPYAINAVRSTETAQALRELADLADRGEIIGVAYVALQPQRRAAIGTVGVARQDPPLVTHWLKRLILSLCKS